MRRPKFLLYLILSWIVLAIIIFAIIFYISSEDESMQTSEATESTKIQYSTNKINTGKDEASGSSLNKCIFSDGDNWISDGICDDRTNVASCDFDGGDCCDEDSIMAFCRECICYEQTTTTSTTTTTYWDSFSTTALPDCPAHLSPYIGDGYCDDQANNYICHHDKLDCCIGTAQSQTYCIACECIHSSTEGCDRNDLQLLGNRECDDETNVLECAWDGGDCCNSAAFFIKCDECICYQNGGLNLSLSETPTMPFCEFFFWKGDGVCDDMNNLDECDYDAGDCCQIGSHQICENCECYGNR